MNERPSRTNLRSRPCSGVQVCAFDEVKRSPFGKGFAVMYSIGFFPSLESVAAQSK